MGAFTAPDKVPEYFVSGVGSIELLSGGISRHILVSERRVGDKTLYIPEVNIIISIANAEIAVMKTARELAAANLGPLEFYTHH